jgi:GNAT superfamily N-acetyltransferase
MLRSVDQQDLRFLRDMLRHAYHWRMGDPELPVFRYVKAWGRRGDAGVVAFEGPKETPELTIAVVPSHRGHGTGAELLEALLDQARSDGFSRVSLSAEPGQTSFYEKHGFHEHHREDRTVTMVADL